MCGIIETYTKEHLPKKSALILWNASENEMVEQSLCAQYVN